MKQVTFKKETEIINATDCHENDGKMYVAVFNNMPKMLYFDAKEGYYKWVSLGEPRLPQCSALFNFRAAINDARDCGEELTQLNNFSELGEWLIKLNQ